MMLLNWEQLRISALRAWWWSFPLLCVLGLGYWLIPTSIQNPAQHPALLQLPAHMLWAWERREDLRWLPANVGVAYVATSMELEGSTVRTVSRASAVQLRPDTVAVPVVHVDASWRNPPVLHAAQQAAVVNQVLAVAARHRHAGQTRVVQLDFEVRQSQRAFLRAVVQDIRRQLPADTALSMTALASWCAGDYWLHDLPADEIVPMAFRMGRDDAQLRAQLNQDGGFTRPRCQSALGTATDEPAMQAHAPRRYHFSPTAWTLQQWQRVSGGL
jgi:hypothetical protein